MEEIFYQYFLDKYASDIIEEVDSKMFSVYFSSLAKKGYSVESLLNKADFLHNEFKANREEITVINDALVKFEDFCNQLSTGNPSLSTLFVDFQTFA
ncbi:MAG: hypothetical protein GXP45_05135 [bacterium]|nr:hypothetical protein [bacterium]